MRNEQIYGFMRKTIYIILFIMLVSMAIATFVIGYIYLT
jgi:hypothetical protein